MLNLPLTIKRASIGEFSLFISKQQETSFCTATGDVRMAYVTIGNDARLSKLPTGWDVEDFAVDVWVQDFRNRDQLRSSVTYVNKPEFIYPRQESNL